MNDADIISCLGGLLYGFFSEVAYGRRRMKRLTLHVCFTFYPEITAFFVLLATQALTVVSVQQAV